MDNRLEVVRVQVVFVDKVRCCHVRIVSFVDTQLRHSAFLHLDIEDVVILLPVQLLLSSSLTCSNLVVVSRTVNNFSNRFPLLRGYAPRVGDGLASLTDHSSLSVMVASSLKCLWSWKLFQLKSTEGVRGNLGLGQQLLVLVLLLLTCHPLVCLSEDSRFAISTSSSDVTVAYRRDTPHGVGVANGAYLPAVPPHSDRPVLSG
mmetsp:Transcript_9103/g.30357  ORF Transcript_9103/g.30357 Transcript_9103/m.30357 type:complete len:203 (-) Transcript_9103:1471-2079(-)